MQIRIGRIVFASALALALAAPPARGQAGPDHMQCYRVTDATLGRLKGIVDLEAPSAGLAPGCKLGKAKLYCVPATQQVQPGTLLDGRTPVSTLPYHGPPVETDRLCYRVKCEKPNGTTDDRPVTDGFGTHQLRKLRTELLCKPATGGTLPPPRSGFQIKTPEIEVPPFANLGQCYHFRTSNSVTVPVKRFASEMRPATRQIVLLTTTTTDGVPVDKRPPGTLTLIDCDTVPDDFGVVAQWLYSADTPTAEMALPVDDGAGNPVAIEIPANAAGYLLMHNVNPSSETVKAQVTINAEALEGPVYTKSSTFMSYDGSIAIPPMTNGYAKVRTCNVPAGARFWRFTTQTHGRAVRSAISDGADVVFETLDWSHPGATTIVAPPFYTFASGGFTYACTYDNPFTFTVRTGESWQSEEQCVAVGHFFPAEKPLRCYDGFPF